ncbi:MAG: nucleoside deaminase [bacterium]
MALDHDHFIPHALEEAKRANQEGNVPLGSLIVKGEEVVGVGRNQVETLLDPTAHAEVAAMRDACRRLKTADLRGTILYTTMEPCPMCLWAIQEGRIKCLVLGARHKEMRRTVYGDYSVEGLMTMTRRKLDMVTGVRVAECEAARRSHSLWVEPPPD